MYLEKQTLRQTTGYVICILMTSFSLITPTSVVFQVIIGGVVGGGFIGIGAEASVPSGGGGSAVEALAAEEKKEENEESDEDTGFSLFD
ncbi:hypothetical protein WN944_014081 [Citrus x changshan-huyou]|uniref:Uncharacterized protein n=1 Tax=Citrus x changshan-huyou TaxID=2935761 RepID=A0AAP0M9Z5_9ROSI